jgi:HAD superfamily hydrolase (TIGR01484 family)
MAIKLISTDFDGTLLAEFEDPPVAPALQSIIGQLQAGGAKWVINTGRDLPSLLDTLERARLVIQPDYLVLVEREIYRQDKAEYVEHHAWNRACHEAHVQLFKRVRKDVPRLKAWVEARFAATIYEDAYSPFCLIAARIQDAEVIHEYLTDYCRGVPELDVMRNSVYTRFCHQSYNKGTALREIAGQLKVTAAETFAAGDHLNDLPMLSREYAHWLAAPENAVESVKEAVRRQNGFVSVFAHGHGVADALRTFLRDFAG